MNKGAGSMRVNPSKCGIVFGLTLTLKPMSHLLSSASLARLPGEPSPGVYFWDIPLVFHRYPACISPYPWYPVYLCIDLYLAILQQKYVD